MSRVVHSITSSLACASLVPTTKKAKKFQADWSNLSKLYLGAKSIVTHMGTKALTARLGVTNQTHVAAKVTMLGSLAFFCSLLFVTSAMAHLLDRIDTGAYEALASITLLGSDATPLPVSQKHKPSPPSAANTSAGPSGPSGTSQSALVPHQHKSRATSAKLQQSELQIVFLVRIVATGEMLMFCFQIPCPLQILQRGSGSVVWMSWRNMMAVPLLETLRGKCKHNMSVYLIDRDSANKARQFQDPQLLNVPGPQGVILFF